MPPRAKPIADTLVSTGAQPTATTEATGPTSDTSDTTQLERVNALLLDAVRRLLPLAEVVASREFETALLNNPHKGLFLSEVYGQLDAARAAVDSARKSLAEAGLDVVVEPLVSTDPSYLLKLRDPATYTPPANPDLLARRSVPRQSSYEA